jgi:hypothetical protein
MGQSSCPTTRPAGGLKKGNTITGRLGMRALVALPVRLS